MKQKKSRIVWDNRTKNTYLLTIVILALMAGSTTFWYFDKQYELPNCSYLSPYIVDLLAFFAGAILMIDAVYHAINPKTRAQAFFILFRFATGATIITIHALQAMKG